MDNIISAVVYPLAFPKGVKYSCELCQKPAHKICGKCRVTFYCTDEHQKSDWIGIHEKICQSLIPLRAPQQFLPSEEERKKRDEDLRNQKIQLIEFTISIAQRYLFESNYERSIPAAMTSLKFSMELHGLKSVDLVPAYLILGEAHQGLGNLNQAQEYLSQAEWTIKKNPDCPLSICSMVYRKIAMLKIAKEEYDEALRNLANDIYNAAEEYGIYDVRVSGGYFLMGNIFFKLGKLDVSDSLYRQVCSMWHDHLRKIVEEQTEISELDTILGKKIEDEVDNEKLDAEQMKGLATQAEANKVLNAIYDIRKNEEMIDENEINRIEHCLAMLHFLAKENQMAIQYANLLYSNANLNNVIKNDLNRMVEFIKMKTK